ncbi:MAG TPA: glycosyltransferase [Ignavibacteria bacterium]|nr:glycosyltransferase [Ignavibacteria bacterium]HMR41244.1 glycosyltransferase [Ignavibacteria bacterium]
MKIIIAGTAFPMRGGIAQYNSLMYKYFSEADDVKVYSFKRQYPEFLFPGKTQFEQGEPAVKIPDDKNVISIDSINPFNWLSAGKKIASENPDLLIFKYWIPYFGPCFAVISYIVKKFSGTDTKVLYICDNVIPHEKRFGDKFFTKLAFSQGDYFVVMSKTVEDDLKLFSKGKPYKLIPHPVYNIFGDKVEKTEAKDFIKKEYDIDLQNEKVILFFGYIRKYKGLNYLIDAMPEILKKVKLKLLVVGEYYGDEEKYREQIRTLGLEEDIKVVSDFVPDSNVKYFFSASDVVVLPYSDATQSGIIQIAYHYDKPVIATDVGGLAEVVRNNETGLIIEPKNPGAIAKAIIEFYENGLEEKFTINAKEEKKKYSWEMFVESVKELINKK